MLSVLSKLQVLVSIQALLSKCWKIQTLIWDPWGASVNCTRNPHFMILTFKDRAITMGALINGFPTIGVNETNGPLHFTLFTPHKEWPLSYKDLSHTQTLVNCSNNACQHHITITSQDQKWHLSSVYAQTAKAWFLTLWMPSHLDFHKQLGGHVNRHVNY